MARDIASWIDHWAAHRPDALALEFEGTATSYQQLASDIEAAADTLHRLGITEGDRVGYLGPNRPEIIHLLFACARIGAIYLPLNSRLSPPEHAWILADADPTVLFEDPTFTDHLDACEVSCRRVALDNNPWPPAADNGTSPRIGTPDHAVLLAYTSGTTGHPKGAVQTQAGFAANAVNSAHAHDLTSADRVLTLLPMFHVGGLSIQTLPALHAGAAVLLHRAFDPLQFLVDVERWRPTLSLLVPATLNAVSQHEDFPFTDFSSLRGLMTGSSTVPEAVMRPYFDIGVPVGQIYGSTEAGPVAVYLRLDEADRHVGSCGKPATHCELRIVAADGNDVTESESGELLVRGASVLREYWNNPGATAEAIQPDGWFHTGDVGHRDPDGWVVIDDRTKDVVISGGENVYPAELENVLADCSDLAEAAVIGRPDDRWGEVPIVIAVRAGDASIDTAEVMGLFDGVLARFKHPKDVLWTDALPRNAMGKVQKHVLRERFVAPPG